LWHPTGLVLDLRPFGADKLGNFADYPTEAGKRLDCRGRASSFDCRIDLVKCLFRDGGRLFGRIFPHGTAIRDLLRLTFRLGESRKRAGHCVSKDMRLPRRVLAEGWWLSDPPKPVAGGAIHPFERPTAKSVAGRNDGLVQVAKSISSF
jgi:hypothetical protein